MSPPPDVRRIGHDVGTKLIHDDRHTRVWMLDLAPGEATEWHEHEHAYVFVVTAAGAVACEYADGSVERQLDDPVGSAHFRPRDVPHRLVNVGDRDYQNVVVELKSAAARAE